MNDSWDQDGGRLRVLNNGTDLNDYAAEIPPDGGTLLVFRRSGQSWHGHEPFCRQAPRRADELGHQPGGRRSRAGRHARSSRFKKFIRFITGKPPEQPNASHVASIVSTCDAFHSDL